MTLSRISVRSLRSFKLISNGVFQLAGLFDPMLCTGCLCCWGLYSYPVEHWGLPHTICMHWNHDLAPLYTSLSRGKRMTCTCVFLYYDSLLVAAFVGTALAFACFSGAAMLARRREYLYLGGLLSSGLSILLWLHFASSIFGGSTSLFMIEVYFGLLLFVGYMVVDTRDIIEKAHLGDLDYVKHALTLFTDFVAVFVRILIIMLKNSEKNGKKKKKRSD
ncbi:hypothetical protein REPUB_Repub07fG0224100 [Reevesia pubescens]